MITLKIVAGFIALTGLLLVAGLTVNQSGTDSPALADEEYDIIVEINGLHCSMCVKNSERSLEEMDQVEEAAVKLEENVAFIKLKADQTVTKEQITEAIEDAGYRTGDFGKFPGDEIKAG
ncbi:MAG: heavy metal-associated domain-containing protein [Balneolaceae bacterium]